MGDINIDDIFEEDLNFKPLSKGLGFHHTHKEAKELPNDLTKKSQDLKKNLELRATRLNNAAKIKPTSSAQSLRHKVHTPDPSQMGELSVFYSDQIETKIEGEEHPKLHARPDIDKDTPVVIEASGVVRFAAWFIDLILISGLLSAAGIAAAMTSGFPLSEVAAQVTGIEVFKTIIPLFVLFYAFYFSFFDKTSFATPGKKLLGITVVNINNRRPSMMQTLARAILTLISVITLGLLVMLDVQSKLTDTKVINN